MRESRPRGARQVPRAINEVLPSPDVREKSKKLGMAMRGSTPEAMRERMKAGIPKHD